jgi:uncharacterized protein (DUF1684 family)
MNYETYIRDVEQWQSDMDANLRRENGWLALAGLFWLRKGINTVGSSPDCDIRLPEQAPPLLGALDFDGNHVTVDLDIGQTTDVNGFPIHSGAVLTPEDDNDASFITFKDLRMVIIRRSHGVALRLWDNLRDERIHFPRRTWFQVDPRYSLAALYTMYPAPAKVSVPNVFGDFESGYVQGYVSFKLDGRSHNLDVSEVDDGRLYICFKDLTSGVETYPAGRYLYSEVVQQDGRVALDFNRAYNPPCAFTGFATCSFAPQSNNLKVAIKAGERYGGHPVRS